jgi:hypothetical protein
VTTLKGLKRFGTVAVGSLIAFIVCTEFTLYALRPAAPIWTYPHTNTEFLLSFAVGGLCAVLLAWRVVRGQSVKEELHRIEQTVTSGDHLG